MHNPRHLPHIRTSKHYDTPTTHDQLIIDTGGGWTPTVTERAWTITGQHDKLSGFIPYGSTGPPEFLQMVDAITCATIQGRDERVLLKLHRATLISDPHQSESLVVPFDMMRNGIAVDCTPLQHGGSASFTYDGEQFPLAYDGEKLFVNIMKPTQNDMDAGEAGMIPTLIMNSPMDAEYHTSGTNRRLSPGIVPPNRVPIAEWQKRLAMLPPDIITKTLANTFVTFGCRG